MTVNMFLLPELLASLPPEITADRTVRTWGRGDRIVEFTRLRGGDWVLDIHVNVDDPAEIELTINRTSEVPAIREILGYMNTQFALSELPMVLREMKRHARKYEREQGCAAMMTVPVGLDHRPAVLDLTRRTEAQRAALQVIISADDFDFACHNPLSIWVSANYRGPFNLLYYTKDGQFNVRRIGANGQTVKHVTSGPGEALR